MRQGTLRKLRGIAMQLEKQTDRSLSAAFHVTAVALHYDGLIISNFLAEYLSTCPPGFHAYICT